MRKTILGTVLALGVATMMSGCAGKVTSCELFGNMKSKDSEVNQREFLVRAKEAWRSPSAAYNVKTRETHLLQNMADVTLHYNYKYFSIISPNNKVNNKRGSLVNTAEGFLETCSPATDANPFTVFNSPCGYDAKSPMSYAYIRVYKVQPYEMTSYDAQAVKDYLVTNKLWRDDGIEAYEEACPKK